ncbi:beta-scruin, partial [Nephila pilipes]
DVMKKRPGSPITVGLSVKDKLFLSNLYIMGAFKYSRKSRGRNVIFNYDLKSRKWCVLTKCPVPRHDARMVATNRALYIIGGCNPLDHKRSSKLLPLRECYKYQFENKEWQLIAPMHHARALHAAVVFKNMILAIGGKNENDRLLSSIERYDVLLNSWEEVPEALPEPRMAMGVAAEGDYMWVVGGFTNIGRFHMVEDSVWCFDNTYKRYDDHFF